MARKPSPSVVAALRFLAEHDGTATPAEIGGAINAVIRETGGKGIGQHGSRYASGGNITPGVLGSLTKRGWVYVTEREDGLSGSAYGITFQGREALKDFLDEEPSVVEEERQFEVGEALLYTSPNTRQTYIVQVRQIHPGLPRPYLVKPVNDAVYRWVEWADTSSLTRIDPTKES